MSDYASALVISLLQPILRIESIDHDMPSNTTGAKVPFHRKRQIVSTILEQAGPLPLLKIAEAIPELEMHPISRVFSTASSGVDLLDRWMRVERYFHSRHRTCVNFTGESEAIVEHLGPPGSPPRAAEDIVVAGLQTGLLRWVGAEDVCLRFLGERDDWPAFNNNGYHAPVDGAHYPTRRWKVTWSTFRHERRGRGLQVEPPSQSVIGRSLSDPLVRKLFGSVMAEPAAKVTLTKSAKHIGLAPRTLQRRLNEAGWSMREIIATARIEVAARLLAEGETPIAIVGLMAGFSDQPHFQREFAKRLGPTPNVYRKLAGAPSPR